jgi:motility quorum-sensing regulator/GCU-specific mRNA interferase toxin
MEKRVPHCDLALVRRLIGEGKVRATTIATDMADDLGCDFVGMVAVVLPLTPKDLYQSTATHVTHRVWQDVYRPATKFGDLYLKLTVIDDVLIVSFKEL